MLRHVLRRPAKRVRELLARRRVAASETIDKSQPDAPFTLSHELNPTLREYRRAMSASIDASLKPVMTRYLGELALRSLSANLRHAA